uniref:NADH dehydrogenase subunit 2 n=1 Tax=Aconurella montana TaxID=2605438 RepID=UPI0024358F46|nr:NADH dehydrogenase subunit 2 [Aconurella montana]WEU77743.1 NADH dehydrogenase subunit 2 [Aconurella montana]
MFFNSTKLMLTNTMMIGVIMTICSNNWVSMWMGMEITLISFVPLMNSNKINSSSESMVKYFIIQSISSTMLLFSVICMLIGVSMMNEIVLTSAMMMKMGFSIHNNWILMIIKHLEYSLLILLTIFKLPPILMKYQINSEFLTVNIISKFMFNETIYSYQSSISKTLTYSSIFNMSLMISSINKFSLVMTFVSIYSINMTFLVMLFSMMKINFINQILFNEFSTWMKLNIWINMLSMSGFPPTLGFVTKMMVIQEMIKTNELILVTIMILTSLLVLFFYTRLAFSSMMISYSLTKWEFLMKMNVKYFMMTASVLLTPLILTLKMVF